MLVRLHNSGYDICDCKKNKHKGINYLNPPVTVKSINTVVENIKITESVTGKHNRDEYYKT